MQNAQFTVFMSQYQRLKLKSIKAKTKGCSSHHYQVIISIKHHRDPTRCYCILSSIANKKTNPVLHKYQMHMTTKTCRTIYNTFNPTSKKTVLFACPCFMNKLLVKRSGFSYLFCLLYVSACVRLGVSTVLKHGQSVKWCNFPLQIKGRKFQFVEKTRT